jgi:signal transduction histidine kinase
MTAGRPEADPPRPPLREQLSEIRQALDALRDRLRELEGREAEPAPPASAAASADLIAAIETRSLASVQEVLSMPPYGFDPEEAFGHAMDRVARLLDADRAMLFVLDQERGHLVPTAARGFRRDDLAGVAIAPGEGVVGRAFVEARPCAYARPADAAPSDPFIARFPVRDAVAVPIQVEGQVMGVLYAGRRGREAPFAEHDILVLAIIADRIATAFAHRELVERAGRHLARLRELQGFSGRTLVGRDLADTLARACEVGCRLLGVRVAALALPAEDGGLRLAASSGLAADAHAWLAEPLAALGREVLASPHPLAWRDVSDGRRESRDDSEPFRARPESPDDAELFRSLHMRSCLMLALRIHDKGVGALLLADSEPREFTPDELEAAQVLASLAALAIENERLYGEARDALQALTVAQERLVQTEKTRALGGMAGGVAHEFNNILAIILGKTQLMLGRAVDDPVREGLGQIEEAAWRAADVVRRLQGFAATRSDEPPALVDLNTLVHDAVTLTRGLWKDEAEARGIRIDVVTDLGETPPVLGSAAELREAVTNLVLNAIDAMPRGGRLRLTTRRAGEATERAGEAIELLVADSGEGMTEDVRRRIFEPFFSTRSPLRTGLGLSVVHGIVSRHRGRVDVSSEEGRGTTVTIRLPVASPAPPPAGTPAARESEPVRAAGPATILVLEDEQQIRDMLVDAIAQAGHQVESAADGLTGLARFQRGRFDVVLTDLSLPERSGLEVARDVKRMRPGTAVVLLTGWGHLVDPARLRDHGVDLTLVKPFRIDRVLAVLGDALRLRAGA